MIVIIMFPSIPYNIVPVKLFLVCYIAGGGGNEIFLWFAKDDANNTPQSEGKSKYKSNNEK
jgi:hypothetical protein